MDYSEYLEGIPIVHRIAHGGLMALMLLFGLSVLVITGSEEMVPGLWEIWKKGCALTSAYLVHYWATRLWYWGY